MQTPVASHASSRRVALPAGSTAACPTSHALRLHPPSTPGAPSSGLGDVERNGRPGQRASPTLVFQTEM